MVYKVTNTGKDLRKFRDEGLGADVVLAPGESAITNRPPAPSEVFLVELAEERANRQVKEKAKKVI